MDEQQVAKVLDRLYSMEVPNMVFKQVPLTSTSWDGDSYSTTAKTLIDLSVVFGVPNNVRAINVLIAIRDSGSSAFDSWFGLCSAGSGNMAVVVSSGGLPNDYWTRGSGIVPCDVNGDCYYQLAASGATTMDVIIYVTGYWL